MPKTHVSSMTSKLRQVEAFVQWNMDWNAQMLREWLDWLLGREYVFPYLGTLSISYGKATALNINDITQGAI